MDEPSVRSAQPTDPDVDLQVPEQRRETREGWASLLAAVALGGALGATARYAATQLWPTPDSGFPWTTLVTNAVGCFAIGVLMALLSWGRAGHRLLRPFLGTGLLGSFTTFSAYALDVRTLVEGAPGAGVAYLALSPLVAIVAVSLAVWGTRAATRRWGPPDLRAVREPAGGGGGGGPGGGSGPEGHRERGRGERR